MEGAQPAAPAPPPQATAPPGGEAVPFPGQVPETTPPPPQRPAQPLGPKIIAAIAYSVAAVVFLLAWFMALIGTGVAHGDCDDWDRDCDDIFRQFWWPIFFELFVVGGVVGCVAFGLLDTTRLALVAFLVLVTVDLGDAAESALQARDTLSKVSAVRAAAGGFILLSILNFVMILALGCKVAVPVPIDVGQLRLNRKGAGGGGNANVPQATAPGGDPIPLSTTTPPPPGFNNV